MKQYQFLSQNKGFRQKMPNKGNYFNNAVMVIFLLFKSELPYLQKFNSIQNFLEELENYIDYYTSTRIKVKLKGLSPVHYGTQSLFIIKLLY